VPEFGEEKPPVCTDPVCILWKLVWSGSLFPIASAGQLEYAIVR